MSSFDPVDLVLGFLDGVKKTAPEKFMARCPAHDDRSPSLSVGYGDDGRCLINCLAGCAPEAVLASLGLTFSDLYPGKQERHQTPPRISPRDILATLDHEALVVAIIAEDLLKNGEIDGPTCERLLQSVARINLARSITAPLRHRP